MQDLPADFWAPRACFEPPPPEVHQAVALLDQAADALIAGDRSRAADLIAQADMPPIFEFVERLWGKIDPHVHRYRDVADAPGDKKGNGSRRPSARLSKEIYERDGWRCRFCGIPVLSPMALAVLREQFPLVARTGSRNVENHFAFLALTAVADHLLPFSRGGDTSTDNLVTTCGPCNYGRGRWTLEEVGLRDPRLTAPIIDSWDGLSRLEGHRFTPAIKDMEGEAMITNPVAARAQERLIDSWRRIAGPGRFREPAGAYTIDVAANLIAGITRQDFDRDFDGAKGNELEEEKGNPAKFCAAFSSSALAVNCFAPFKARPQDLVLADQKGFGEVAFERVCPTGLPGSPPHLDVFCTAGNRIVAVESKCTEYLTPKPAKFRDSYGTLADLFEPAWDEVFRMLNANPVQFAPLDAAQLVKHYLGLRNSHRDNDVTLLYLFWEPEDAADHSLFRDHRRQIAVFARLVQASSIRFAAASYGELWAEWRRQDVPWLNAHIGRLQDRYGVRLS